MVKVAEEQGAEERKIDVPDDGLYDQLIELCNVVIDCWNAAEDRTAQSRIGTVVSGVSTALSVKTKPARAATAAVVYAVLVDDLTLAARLQPILEVTLAHERNEADARV